MFLTTFNQKIKKVDTTTIINYSKKTRKKFESN